MANEIDRPHERTSAVTTLRRGAVPFLCGLLALGLLAFIVQNRQQTDVHWLTWTFTAPLWVALILPVVIAVAVAALATLIVVRRRRSRARRDRADRQPSSPGNGSIDA